jgi:hypothetical protein
MEDTCPDCGLPEFECECDEPEDEVWRDKEDDVWEPKPEEPK